MDNLRKSIRLLFVDYCPDFILKTKCSDDFISYQRFLENGFKIFLNYSIDEINNVYQLLNTDWFTDLEKSEKKNYFNVLLHFTSRILIEENLEPFVNYKHFLKWRELSYFTGEDMLTTSFFAYLDNRSQRKRDYFAWRPTVFCDNKRLKQLLNKGLADNHFHLKGSGPVFDLSWINLMNNPTDFEREFRILESELVLQTRTSNAVSNSKKEMKILVYKAAYIRLKLYDTLNGIGYNDKFEIDLSRESNGSDSIELIIWMNELRQRINLFKFDMGHKFVYNGESGHVIDYAIPQNIHISNLSSSYVFYGERKFLYDCFRLIYSDDNSISTVSHLFHAYLLIKAQVRSELVLVNDKVGFANFSKYQDRKEYFLPSGSIYHAAFVNLAVHDTKKHIPITSLELRIAPKDSVVELRECIDNYSDLLNINSIQSESNQPVEKIPYNLADHNIFYTLHFIKLKEEKYLEMLANEIFCRHHRLRRRVKDQCLAISNLRESCSSSSNSIRGIDAASNEFDANPEVFAQAFRYLKNHKLKGNFNHLKENISEVKLYSTYHVGEDFYDLVDGLRSIDECIHFLNLKQGDRIGHGLALGIDVDEYYAFKQQTLMVPKQIVLDNIVWLLSKIRKFGINAYGNEVTALEKLYETLYHEVYTSNFDDEHPLKIRHIHHTTYYNSWKLRGDDPYLYINAEQDVYDKNNVSYWERCRINEEYPELKSVRRNIDVRRLYQQYHFNSKVKESGKQIKQFKITYSYTQLVKAVQLRMMHDVKNKNIAIETNPTSNVLIGTFKRYSKHPISKLFNLGLEMDHEANKNCPQLSVSINTDDQGIISTSLENEYALMAIALEKEKDLSGNPRYNSSMIYDWLERVRLMGMGQSFND